MLNIPRAVIFSLSSSARKQSIFGWNSKPSGKRPSSWICRIGRCWKGKYGFHAFSGNSLSSTVTLVTPISSGCTVEKHLRYAFVQGRSNTPPSPCPVSITSACNDFVDSLRAAQSCGKARNEARAPTHRRKGSIRLGREILDWACFGAGTLDGIFAPFPLEMLDLV